MYNAVNGIVTTDNFQGCLYPDYDNGTATTYNGFNNAQKIVLTEEDTYQSLIKRGTVTIDTHIPWTNVYNLTWIEGTQRSILVKVLDPSGNELNNAHINKAILYNASKQALVTAGFDSGNYLGVNENTKYIRFEDLGGAYGELYTLPTAYINVSNMDTVTVQLIQKVNNIIHVNIVDSDTIPDSELNAHDLHENFAVRCTGGTMQTITGTSPIDIELPENTTTLVFSSTQGSTFQRTRFYVDQLVNNKVKLIKIS